jgi:hypothetical protein
MKKISLILASFLSYSYSFGQSSNMDFESSTVGAYTTSTAVSGWTVSSQNVANNCSTPYPWTPGSNEFSIVSTPLINFPEIGNIPNSPLGGTKVAQLNNTTPNTSATRLSRTIAVTNSNLLFQYAVAGVWQNGGHLCCEQPFFQVVLKDATGAPQTCYTTSLSPQGSTCPSSSTMVYSVSTTASWTNWQVRCIDLSPFLNTTVTIEIIAADCFAGGHYGMLFFDATFISPICFPWPLPPGVTLAGPITQSNFCPGSNLAILQAPFGYNTYSWVPPPGSPPISASQSTLPVLTVTNPIVSSVYSVQMTTPVGCVYVATVAVAYSQISIPGLGTSSACAGGSSGSATVIPQGSGVGYSYVWTNSSNSVVSTSSVMSGVTAGVYNVTVTAAGGFSSCGTATATTTVSLGPPGSTISILKPFCGNTAYLSVNGSNFQWYSNGTAITASLGGTSPSLAVSNPTNTQSNIWVGYHTPQGCRDSVNFTLVAVPPGSVNVQNISWVCPGGNNGTALVNMTPVIGTLPGSNTFSVWGSPTVTPAYIATLAPTAQNQFSLSGLSAGTYSVKAFDGSCLYSASFSVNPFIFNYTLSTAGSKTLCPGNMIPAGITFTSPPSNSQYTYSWSPNQFLIGNIPTLQNTIITPTAAPGTINTIVYTVVVTPSVINCPLAKTFTIHSANPAPPTIQPIPAICDTEQYTVSVSPAGGYFSSQNFINSSGVITASLATPGINTFSYSASLGTCAAMTSAASFSVMPSPIISVSGNTNICQGQSTNLLAGGANTFTWSNAATGPLISVSPIVSTTYTVSGTNISSNCSGQTSIAVNVLPLPSLNITGNLNICAGQNAMLAVSGAITYTWNNGSNFTLINVSPTVTTVYSVVGMDFNSCTNTKTVSVNVQDCSGLEELGQNQIKIFPNPTKDLLIIESSEPIDIIIYDALANVILEKHLDKNRITVDLSAYSNGVYFVKTTKARENKIYKVIKNN